MKRQQRFVDPNRLRHRCTVCGRVDHWSDCWEWYGSYKDIDDARPVVKTCSEACRRGLSAPVLNDLRRRLGEDDAFVLRPEAPAVGWPGGEPPG